MTKYRKALAAVGGVLAVVGQALADGNVSLAETGAIVTALLVAFGVYQLKNTAA